MTDEQLKRGNTIAAAIERKKIHLEWLQDPDRNLEIKCPLPGYGTDPIQFSFSKEVLATIRSILTLNLQEQVLELQKEYDAL